MSNDDNSNSKPSATEILEEGKSDAALRLPRPELPEWWPEYDDLEASIEISKQKR